MITRYLPSRLLPRDGRGLATLESAVVLGVFFLLLFGAMDLARYFLTEHGLNTVVSEAARVSMINNWSPGCSNPTSGTGAAVLTAAPFLDPTKLTLCVTTTTNVTNSTNAACPSPGTCTNIAVTARYPFSFMIAPLSGANGTLFAETQLLYATP